MRMVHLPAGGYDGVPERSRCVLRKDRVLETLRSLCSQRPVQNGVLRRYSGYSAEEVARQAQVDRTNASRDLNLLVQEGLVERIPGRPVLFTLKTPSISPLQEETWRDLKPRQINYTTSEHTIPLPPQR